jgi:hypothetical protein
MIRQTSNYTVIDMDWMPSSEEPTKAPSPPVVNRPPPLAIRIPQRKPTLTEANLEDLKTLDITTPEWNIHVGNTLPEHIPNNLKMKRKSRRKRQRRHRRALSRKH